MPSDKNNAVEANAMTAELLNKLKSEFPKAPDPAKVWTQACKNAFKREVDRYNNKDETTGKVPRYFAEIGPLKYQNFVKHILKNIRQLENVANSIYMDHERQSCEKLYAEFQAETQLKSAVMRAIMEIPKFESFSSDFKSDGSKSRREQLMEGGTELQLILKSTHAPSDPPSEKVKADGYSVSELWKDKWHPINLTLNFDMFQRIVNQLIQQRKNPLKELIENKGHENTYKRHYLRYMFKTAESNQEFLLAIISYGTDVRFYPSKVLEFLQNRGMLKDKFEAFKPSNPQSFKGFTFSMGDDSIVPKQNAEYLKKYTLPNPLARKSSSSTAEKPKPLIQIVKLVDLTEDVDVDNFNDCRRSRSKEKEVDRRKSSGKSSSSRANTSSSNRQSTCGSGSGGGGSSKAISAGGGGSSKASSQSTKSKSATTNKVGSTGGTGIVRTVTQEVKTKKPNVDDRGKAIAVTEEVFCESTRKLWQMFFDPGFNLSSSIASVWYQGYLNHVKAHRDQLNNCISMLLQDRQKSSHFDIPRLPPSMIQLIQADFMSLELSRRSGGPFNFSTVEGIMYSQSSPLQLSLHDHTINKSIPGPTGWSPTNCHMPYQAFEGHLEWRLAQLGKSLEGLELEMVKLRYVEYLSLVSNEGKHLILGVFTAYGPDLYLYPIRVLQLLKKKQIFRAGTKLYTLIQLPVEGRAYTVLVPMKAPPSTDRSDLREPPPFTLHMLPIPDPNSASSHPMGQSFQPQMHSQPLMEMNSQYGQPRLFQEEPQQFPYHHPLNDFPHNGYSDGLLGEFGNHYQGPAHHEQGYMQHPDSQFMNPPQPVPPPSQLASNNIMSNMPIPHSQEGPKSNPLPSILPMEIWKSACERSLTKYGPKYGIGRLSDKDYKVLYDRYLFDTFDNPDDFVRGILTGISLARYPRDDEEPINTSGLLNLPSSSSQQHQQPSIPKPILKPILKAPTPAPSLPAQVKPNSIKMSRDDLLRISTLLEQLIPNAEASSSASSSVKSNPVSAPSRPQLDDSTRLVDYNHHGGNNARDEDEFEMSQFRRPTPKPAPPPPTRRNYDEEDRGFEDRARIIDYDHFGSNSGGGGSGANQNAVNQRLFQRLTTGGGGGTQGRGTIMNPNKRSAPPDHFYEDYLQKRHNMNNMDTSDYNYR